ncbi:MAG: hypothetical protein ABSD74_11405 [Rhizomicrobium sp.]|jgi:hypothetical protein
MRSKHRSNGFRTAKLDAVAPRTERGLNPRAAGASAAEQNSPEEIFGEIGLVLVVVLGVVLAVNMIVVALHLG